MSRSAASLVRVHVLVALSGDVCSTACGEFLSSFGWEVARTTDPSMAVRLLTFRRYDAVIADLEFENWQCARGVDVVRAARRRGGDAVVVLLTSAGDAASEALAAGADFVVRKPMPLDVLADLVLDTSIQRRRATGAGAPPLRPRTARSRQSPLT